MAEDRETDRLEVLSGLDVNLADFAPGTFGCHEALHSASIAMDFVDDHLLSHPTIVADPEFYGLASEAFATLFALYQAIGAKHLNDGSK